MSVGGSGSLGSAVLELTTDGSGLDRGLAEGQRATNTAALSMQQSLERVGHSMMALGTRATAMLTTPIIGAVAGGVAAFGRFDDAMTQSVAIMGNVNAQMRADMERTARSVATSTTFGAHEAAEAYFFLASAGLDAQSSIEALPQVAQFAQAGMFDLATATDLLTDAQSALGMVIRDDAIANMENMSHLADVLVGANTLANASVQQFSEAMTNRAGPAMRMVNMEVEEGVAVLAAFADQGIKGAEAGTRFDIVLRDMQRRAIESADEMERLGISVFDAEGNMNNMADIIGDLEQALDGMSDEMVRSTLMQLGFNDRSVASILALVGMSDQIRIYEDELRSMSGVVDEVANNQLESFNAQMSLARDRMIDAGITLGETLAPYLVQAAIWISELVESFSDLEDSIQRNILIVAGIAAALGPLLMIGGMLALVLSKVTLAFIGLAAAAAGIAALGWVIYQNWEGLQERFPAITSAVEWLGDAFVKLLDIGRQVFPHLIASVAMAGSIIGDTLEIVARGIETTVRNMITTAESGITAIERLTRGDLRGAWDALMEGSDEIQERNEIMFEAMQEGWDSIANAPDVYTDTLGFVEGAIGAVGDAWDSFRNKQDDAFAPVGRHNQMLQEHGESLGQVESQIRDVSAAMDGQAERITTLGHHYDQLHGAVDGTRQSMSHWGSMAQDAESALEILNAEIEANGFATKQQQEELELLEWWLRRAEGGVHDLGLEFKDGVLDVAEFHRLHGILREELDDGSLTLEQYEDAVADLNERFADRSGVDEFGNAVETASGMVGDLIDGLRDILVELGILEAQDPEISIDINDQEAIERTAQMQDRADTLADTDVTLVPVFDSGQALEDILFLEDNIDNIPDEVETDASMDISQPERDIPRLRGLIDGVPREFTITPRVNMLPFETDIQRINDMTPHSPAKIGPLSVEPNWGWLFEGLSREAKHHTEEAIGHAENFARAVQAISGAGQSQLDFAIAVSGFRADGVELPEDAFVSELARRSEHMLRSLGDAAAELEEDFAEEANRYANAVQSGWSALGAQIDFASAHSQAIQEEGFGLPDDDFISELKFRSEHATESLMWSAIRLSKVGVDAAGHYGQALQGVWSGLSANLDFAVAHSRALEEGDFGLPSDEFVSELKFQSEHAARSLADSAAVLDLEAVEAGERFSQALRGMWAGLGGHLAFAADHSRAIEDENFGLPDDEFIDALVEQSQRTARAMAAATERVDSDMQGAAAEFGDTLGSVFGGLGEVVSFVVASQSMSRRRGMQVAEDAFVELLTEIVVAYSLALHRVHREIGPEILEGTMQVAEMLAPVASLIPQMSEAFHSIEEMSELSETKMDRFVENMDTVMSGIHRLTEMAAQGVSDASLFEKQMASIMASLRQAAALMSDGSGSGGGGQSGGSSSGGGAFARVPIMDDGALVEQPTLALLAQTSRAQPEIVTPERKMYDTVVKAIQEVGGLSGEPPIVHVHLGNKEFDGHIDTRVDRRSSRRLTGRR